jgi:toxin CcdB
MAANDAPTPTRRLNPTFKITDKDYVMVTQFLAAVPLAILKQPVTTLAEHDTEITAALDMAFFGF